MHFDLVTFPLSPITLIGAVEVPRNELVSVSVLLRAMQLIHLDLAC